MENMYDACYNYNSAALLLPAAVELCAITGPLFKENIAVTRITRPIVSRGGDVPDGNDATGTSSPHSHSPSPEPLDLRREDHRLRTLADWPPNFMDAAKTARTGFYYYGDRDMVRCHFCKIELHKWKEGDDIVADHGRWSPNCPLLLGLPCGNLPLSRDECGTREPRAPNNPSLMTFQSRHATFHNWPSHSPKQTPQTLADAGFYYTGLEDQTVCYHCGGGLKDWEEDDDPWEQHATWFPRCRYVLAVKGEQYVKDLEAATASSSSAPVPAASATAALPSLAAAAVSSDRSTASVEEEDSKMCKICFGEERSVCFVPCGHVVACAKCAMSVLTCPICRKPFTSTMRLYYS